MASFFEIAVKNADIGMTSYEIGYSADSLEAAKAIVMEEHTTAFGDDAPELVWTERKTGLFAKPADKSWNVSYRIRAF